MRDLAASNAVGFLMAFPNGAVLDEAQKVPEIFDALKLLVDRSKWEPGKFILTGSSQFKLKQNMSDSMAGRAVSVSLYNYPDSRERSVNRDEAGHWNRDTGL